MSYRAPATRGKGHNGFHTIKIRSNYFRALATAPGNAQLSRDSIRHLIFDSSSAEYFTIIFGCFAISSKSTRRVVSQAYDSNLDISDHDHEVARQSSRRRRSVRITPTVFPAAHRATRAEDSDPHADPFFPTTWGLGNKYFRL